MMILEELKKQALQLPISDRLRLVQSVLTSIQQETIASIPSIPNLASIAGLDPWTQSLIGIVPLSSEDFRESYVDYLEEKYS
jgi:hypothetical protein